MDRPFEEMASSGRAVREAEHDVNVEARVVVVADCNVPNGAQHLTLLIHFDFLVGLAGEIKPAHRRSFEGADRRQRGGRNPRFPRKSLKTRKCLLAIVQGHDANVGWTA